MAAHHIYAEHPEHHQASQARHHTCQSCIACLPSLTLSAVPAGGVQGFDLDDQAAQAREGWQLTWPCRPLQPVLSACRRDRSVGLRALHSCRQLSNAARLPQSQATHAGLGQQGRPPGLGCVAQQGQQPHVSLQHEAQPITAHHSKTVQARRQICSWTSHGRSPQCMPRINQGWGWGSGLRMHAGFSTPRGAARDFSGQSATGK
jgi:hypothetical protein